MKRFWDKVEKTENCWIWNGASRGKSGYGCIKVDKKVIDVHRLSWILAFGEIPDKKCILHKCDNRKCVNPDHLFLGTYKENYDDMVTKGRRYSVPHGSRSKYCYGCRCDLCRVAHVTHQRNFRIKNRDRLNNRRREINILRKLEGKKII